MNSIIVVGRRLGVPSGASYFRAELIESSPMFPALVKAYAWNTGDAETLVRTEASRLTPCRFAEVTSVEAAVEQAFLWRDEWEDAINNGKLAKWIEAER